jgi:hypothetical protein
MTAPIPAPSAGSPLHFSRYECKYVLDAARRQQVEADLAPFLRTDARGRAPAAAGYFVRSLYFDDPVLSAFHAKMDGLRTRSKFRLRTYATGPDDTAPWYLERKGRHDGRVFKHRTLLQPGFDPRARGDRLVREVLRHAAQSDVRDQFEMAVVRHQLAPMVLVDYRRSAYHSPLASDFRVTLDGELRAQASDAMWPATECGRALLRGQSVMEVKFAQLVPAWFHRIAQMRELHRRSLSKVCAAILDLGLESGGRSPR